MAVPVRIETIRVNFSQPELVHKAFDFFETTLHGKLYANAERPQLWLERLIADDTPHNHNPVFGLAVAIEKVKGAEDRIVGLVTHDFHLASRTGQPIYHGIAENTDVAKATAKLQEAQRRDLAAIAGWHRTRLHAITEEIEKDGGKAFQKGKMLNLDYAQPAWEEGKTAHIGFNLNWHSLTEEGKEPKKLLNYLDSFHRYFTGGPLAASVDPKIIQMREQVEQMIRGERPMFAATPHADAATASPKKHIQRG